MRQRAKAYGSLKIGYPCRGKLRGSLKRGLRLRLFLHNHPPILPPLNLFTRPNPSGSLRTIQPIKTTNLI